MNLGELKANVVFNKLFVNNMENSSGIFIGTNQAIGWSSISKSNQGFGSLREATLSHSVSFVQDPDVIDTPVEDITVINSSEVNSPLQQCAIEFNSIHANSLSNAATIDLGDNKQPGWRSARKANYGFGKNLGSNQVEKIACIILDDDLIDAPFNHKELLTDNVRNVERNIQITQKNNECE